VFKKVNSKERNYTERKLEERTGRLEKKKEEYLKELAAQPLADLLAGSCARDWRGGATAGGMRSRRATAGRKPGQQHLHYGTGEKERNRQVKN
jgi:hypothetical protein